MWNIIALLNSCFPCEYMLKCNLFLWSKLYFQHHYCSLQSHMIFRNHSNILICCSTNISDYYRCWKRLCCTIFLWKLWYILFVRIHRWIESWKEQHLFETEMWECHMRLKLSSFVVFADGGGDRGRSGTWFLPQSVWGACALGEGAGWTPGGEREPDGDAVQ